MNSASDDRDKWALLIGINRYPMFAPRGQLSGCVNDVQVMRQVLVESFKFPEDHVKLLADEQATREGILMAMKELVALVGEDDIVVVHYSGHGSQMTDREGDEADGLDETILPYDTGRDPHPNLDISDDEIYLWLKDLTAKTQAVTLIFDCCHSGTIARDSFGGEMRWIEADLRPVEDLPPSPIPLEARALSGGRRDLGPSGWLPLGERYVLIAGCSSDERSYEMEEPAGVRHGALTYFLTQELLKAEPGTTYRDVFEITAPRVSSRLPNQHPQLEGARDLEVFGVRRIEPMAFVPVREREGERIVLGAGAACGLREGSQWAIYASGKKAVASGEEPLGVVSITSVRAVTSDGTLLRESQPGAVAAGMRAVEESRALETRMPVQVEVLSRQGTDVSSLLEGLDRHTLLRRAERDEYAKARVYLLPPGTSAARKRAVPTLPPLTEETWAVVGENGDLMMPPHRRSEPGVVQTLLDNLEKAARYQLALDLRNERSPLAGKVEVELLRWTGNWLEEPEQGPDGRPSFLEGDQLALKIVNRYDRPLFVYVLDLGLTGRIHQAYPVPGAKESLEPGHTIEVGTRSGEEMALYIPEEFPFAATEDSAVEGFETLKFFVTTDPTDFLPFIQTGFREWKEGPAGPVRSLSDLLSVTFGGGGYRDVKIPSQSGAREDWTTVERSFRLRRRAAAAQMAAGGRRV
jgi:caspase domain-containing protein